MQRGNAVGIVGDGAAGAGQVSQAVGEGVGLVLERLGSGDDLGLQGRQVNLGVAANAQQDFGRAGDVEDEVEALRVEGRLERCADDGVSQLSQPNACTQAHEQASTRKGHQRGGSSDDERT